MSALLKNNTSLSNHYWMLWIAPSISERQKIKNLPLDQQQKVLMLHPKNNTQVCDALKTAIISGLYQSITLDRSIIPSQQQRMLEVIAMRHQTHINWLNSQSKLNSASQLSLI
ncbi:hypothetical protein NBRC116188_01090 [Oceaniserpentilla sp. 4NH20-0058]|uniref:hypothetical protein n=1 Tax=Oceaniserpentilla sp. 4NH20-0058 TaxID=3127660 RepID=UPI003106B972